MGEVWAAVSDDQRREVAIKVLLARAAMKPDLVRRFEREAKIASAIKSPFVCQLLEVGQADDGSHLLVFEHLTGESLADRLKREQYLPFSEVGPIIDDVLQGLAAAHAAGVIHRDLKPGNIFIEQLPVDSRRYAPPSGGFGTPGGLFVPNSDELEPRLERAKILDFGISKLLRREKEEPTLTAFDATLGSFAYMAPEQVRGAARADERADIYAVGAVAFRALSGRLPFEGTTAAVLVAMKLDRTAPSLHEATGDHWPAGLERFLERALERKRERRFGTALEALTAWRSIQPANITRARRSAARSASTPSRPPPPYDLMAEQRNSATMTHHAHPQRHSSVPTGVGTTPSGQYPPSGFESPPSFDSPPMGAYPPVYEAGKLPGPFAPQAPSFVPQQVPEPQVTMGAVPSPDARPPIQSYVPLEDNPTEVDGPPTMTIDGMNGIETRENPKRNKKTGRP